MFYRLDKCIFLFRNKYVIFGIYTFSLEIRNNQEISVWIKLNYVGNKIFRGIPAKTIPTERITVRII